jgi:hypothetical protein
MPISPWTGTWFGAQRPMTFPGSRHRWNGFWSGASRLPRERPISQTIEADRSEDWVKSRQLVVRCKPNEGLAAAIETVMYTTGYSDAGACFEGRELKESEGDRGRWVGRRNTGRMSNLSSNSR